MHYALQVPGAKSGGTLEVTSPFDGKPVATVETIDESGAERALEVATGLYGDRNALLPAHQRVAILARTADLMRDRFEALVRAAVLEGGKPLTDTRLELERAIDGVKNCIECIRNEHGSEVPMQLNVASANRVAFTRREPVGVVVAVSAFNHPINLIVHQVGPAVASGCPIIIKPAQETPAICFEFVNLLREAGLPEGWCQAVAVSDLSVAEKLVTDSRVAFFSFIGSANVGWMLRSKLAPGTRCALEHGGAAPVIVAPDADLDDALPLLTKGGFYHAGQVCVSVQRVFAQSAVFEEVSERLAALAGTLQVGDPLKEETDVGPLIRHRETDRVSAWVDEAVRSGADLLHGGERLSPSLYAPTVLANPAQQAIVSQKEIFGPVICTYEYDDLKDAVRRANGLPLAFHAAVMSRDIDTAMYAYKHLAASAVMVNDHTAFRVDWMPFAGLRQSGYGVGGIPHTYRQMQFEKMLVFRSSAL